MAETCSHLDTVEDWWWRDAVDLFFEDDGAPPSPSHP
jgi:hypothetical protein